MIDILLFRERIGCFRQSTKYKSRIRLRSLTNNSPYSKVSNCPIRILVKVILVFLLGTSINQISSVSCEKDLLKASFTNNDSQIVVNNCMIKMTGNFFAKYLHGNIKKTVKGIRAFHVNIRSLQNKVGEVKKLVQDISQHILARSVSSKMFIKKVSCQI